MPKSIQTRFVGIRDNHNHYTSLQLLFSIITDLLILTCSRYAILGVFLTCMWEKFMFTHVSHFYDPHAAQKASLGDVQWLRLSLIPTNLVFILFGIAIPTSSFNFIHTCFCSFCFGSATTVSIIIEDTRCQSSRVHASSHASR